MLSKLKIIFVFSFLFIFLNAKPFYDTYQSLLDTKECVFDKCLEKDIDFKQKCNKKCYEDNNISHVYDALVKCYYECASKPSEEISICTNGCTKALANDIVSGKINTKGKSKKSSSSNYKVGTINLLTLFVVTLSIIVF
ncbi:hypothetical protein BB559_000345 [Furculomyces boomerangus]|uniref:Transmembrane protein n=2 Tax=Harpellales TaxID=61421 RepID=A0A2T9Z5I2_9FUNG|nr:hypothetical protein BB559_000345 [Furculomyces boomerangus]PWA01658.1 hypothetical protein BB558_002220 [Smittium angustum]